MTTPARTLARQVTFMVTVFLAVSWTTGTALLFGPSPDAAIGAGILALATLLVASATGISVAARTILHARRSSERSRGPGSRTIVGLSAAGGVVLQWVAWHQTGTALLGASGLGILALVAAAVADHRT